MLSIGDLDLSDYRFTIKCRDPWVVLIHDFLSDDEINHLLMLSQNRFRRSFVVGANDAQVVHKDRTSTSCMFSRSETEILSRIEERVAKVTGVSSMYMEPYQLVKYETSQQYSPHFDFFPRNELYSENEIEQRGQRCLTLLAYLAEPLSGGETFFPRISLKVPPTRGSAVLWFNTGKDGTEDPRTEHGGLPVYDGTKIAMNIWLRNKEYK